MATMAQRHRTSGRHFLAIVRRLALGGLVAGGATGALGGAIVAAVWLAQPDAGFARWFPLVLACGGLLGATLGQLLGGGRASLIARSGPLLGAIAGLLAGEIAWLAAARGTLGGAIIASGHGLLLGCMRGACVGLCVGLIAGCSLAGFVFLAERTSRATLRSRAAIIVSSTALTLTLTLGLAALRRFVPAATVPTKPDGAFFVGFMLLPRLLIGVYVAYAAAWILRQGEAGLGNVGA